ncbi:MAG: rhodanese-like domain-containing protein [bacterium]|nr:MAG: rhodanese-like domain-containing protein [bacterium]
MRFLKSLYMVFFFLTLIHTSGCSQSSQEISPEEVNRLRQNAEDIIIIDVRTPEEFTGELGHIPGAVLRPLQQIETWESEFSKDKGKKIIMVCRSGNRSGVSTQYFMDKGYENVYNMSGGMRAWNKLTLPIEQKNTEK